MRQALNLARRGLGTTSPNPMVGAILVRGDKIIGRGWHQKAGEAHAEIEAINNALRRGAAVAGSTLFVTLEPCCTQGRTPPCTEAIIKAGIRRVIIGSEDPNPKHCGRGAKLLRRAGLEVIQGVLEPECTALNEVFFHWIRHRRPFVTVKAAMTLDGKIATANGQSKWITGTAARAHGMELRRAADAILVGINTILADDPSLTFRAVGPNFAEQKPLRRIVLDSNARTPLVARVLNDADTPHTLVVVSRRAPVAAVARLRRKTSVLLAPSRKGRIDLDFLLDTLGREGVTHLLVEGGGEVNASFLMQHKAQRVAFYYAPKILGGKMSRTAVSGEGARDWTETIELENPVWRRLGEDWLLTGHVK